MSSDSRRGCGGRIDLLVDGDDLNVSVLYGISEDNSTDSTETVITSVSTNAPRKGESSNVPVDTDFDRHCFFYDG